MDDAPQPDTSPHPVILLVDDNLLTRTLNSRILKTGALDVVEAVDGQLGLDQFVTNPSIDLVLMDIEMPVMDGIDSIRAMRAWESEGNHPRRPIIVLTAQNTPTDKVNSMAAGADAFLAKPTLRPILLKAVLHWLEMLRTP